MNQSIMLAAHPPWRPGPGLIVALLAAAALIVVTAFQ